MTPRLRARGRCRTSRPRGLGAAVAIVTSNREPFEWLTMMSDALLAQSAVDRLTAGAHTLIIEGPSYRQRTRPSQRAGIDSEGEARDAH